jgi:sRNA-binding regulator protein Hfq
MDKLADHFHSNLRSQDMKISLYMYKRIDCLGSRSENYQVHQMEIQGQIAQFNLFRLQLPQKHWSKEFRI